MTWKIGGRAVWSWTAANAFRSALVAPKVEVAGFARIFRILNRNPQIDVQVFDRLEAAEAWLKSPPGGGPG